MGLLGRASATNAAIKEATPKGPGHELTAAEIETIGDTAARELASAIKKDGPAGGIEWGAAFQKKMEGIAKREENAGVRSEIHQMLVSLKLPGLKGQATVTTDEHPVGWRMGGPGTQEAKGKNGCPHMHMDYAAPDGAFVPNNNAPREMDPAALGRAVAPALPTGPIDVNSMSVQDREAFVAIYKEFGPRMIEMHEWWHSLNGSGGMMGPESGEKFLQFHANLMKDIGDKIAKDNPGLWQRLNKQLPAWDTTKRLPKEFEFEGMDPRMKGVLGINWKPPSYLTAKGGSESFVLDDGARHKPPVKTTPKTIRSLNDIKTPDELGRVLGMSGAHGVGHVRLAGEMGLYSSISLPAFALWHGKIDSIRKEWLTTDSGKAWLKKHPSGFTDPNANSHSQAMSAMAAPKMMAMRSPGKGKTPESALMDEMRSVERLQPGSLADPDEPDARVGVARGMLAAKATRAAAVAPEIDLQLAAQGRSMSSWVLAHPDAAKKMHKLSEKAIGWDQAGPDLFAAAALGERGDAFVKTWERLTGRKADKATKELLPLLEQNLREVREGIERRGADPSQLEVSDLLLYNEGLLSDLPALHEGLKQKHVNLDKLPPDDGALLLEHSELSFNAKNEKVFTFPDEAVAPYRNKR